MRSVKMFLDFLNELTQKKNLIYQLTKRDFKTVYLGSYLGIVWAFLLPLANVFIFWFVFQVGFKSKPVAHLPYILWYVVGMIIWNFFNDCINTGMMSVMQNSFVVKKVAFSIGILPIIKILSALIIHLFFILFVFILYISYGEYPTLYNLQIVYYLFATSMFVLGLSWLTSSVVIFFRDLRQIISIILQFGFFMTPIFWTPNIMPEQYRCYLKLNPLYYLVQGYRDAFVNKVWFWAHPVLGLYFWTITLFLFVAGAIVFRRLRPHFADIL